MSSAMHNSISLSSQSTQRASRATSDRMSEVLFHRFQTGGGAIPRLLQNAVQKNKKHSSGTLKAEIAEPDSIVLEELRLGLRNRRPGDEIWRSEDPEDPHRSSIDVSEEKLFADHPYMNEFLVKDKQWRDNNLNLGHGSPFQRLALIAAGPGGAYQLMYRAYCSLATLSLVLFVLCLLVFAAIALLVVPICRNGPAGPELEPPTEPGSPAPAPTPAKSRRQAVFVLGIVASACGVSSITLIFLALLVKAWAVYYFSRLRFPEPAVTNPEGSKRSTNWSDELVEQEVESLSEWDLK